MPLVQILSFVWLYVVHQLKAEILYLFICHFSLDSSNLIFMFTRLLVISKRLLCFESFITSHAIILLLFLVIRLAVIDVIILTKFTVQMQIHLGQVLLEPRQRSPAFFFVLFKHLLSL